MTGPLCIDSVQMEGGGRIGMTACPGRWRMFGTIGIEHDGLQQDLDQIKRWGARCLVSLVEQFELDMLGLDDLPRQAKRRRIEWLHLPIPDYHAPDTDFELAWAYASPRIIRRLQKGQNVALHCLAGLGRTGTVTARLLIDLGLSPDEAVRLVRATRPGAIQNQEQERYILEQRWPDPMELVPRRA